SGPLTVQAVDQSDLRRVCETVKDVPVFANTGVNKDNVRDILSVASCVIIGTHFKVDGNTWNPVDGDLVKRFIEIVEALR
ncbi:BtpA/SgcQ family protein, partial [Rhizobium ruizarguesonis]